MIKNIWIHIKNYKLNSMFIKSFFVVFILFCIPFLAISGLYYNNLHSAVYQDIEEENESILYEMRDLSDTALQQCESLCTYIANHSQAQMFAINNWYGKADIYNSFAGLIQSLPLIYDYIDSVYIYSDINKTILSGGKTITPAETFEDKDWMADYEEVTSAKGAFSARLKHDNYPMIISVIKPIFVENDNIGAVILNINVRELCGNYIENRKNEGQQLLMLSKSGQIYVSNNREMFLKSYKDIPYLNVIENLDKDKTFRREIDGEENLISVTESDKFPFYYVNVKSMSFYNDRLKNMAIQIIFMIAVLVLISVAVSYYIAARSYRPVMDIISVLDNPEKYSATGRENYDEIKYIISNILKNINTTEEMKSEMESRLALLKEAQIAMLQLQINPHFLYNTLDTINWMAVELSGGENNVSRAVTNLAGLYRTNINTGDYLVTLKEEMNQAKMYINILKLRYDELFDVVWDISDDSLSCIVLKICMQPIIENAVYHGLKPLRKGGLLTVRCCRADNKIAIIIQDNGVGIEENELETLNRELSENVSSVGKKGHIGLYNVNQRVKLIYGEEYGVFVNSEKNSGTIVRIIFPETYM